MCFLCNSLPRKGTLHLCIVTLRTCRVRCTRVRRISTPPCRNVYYMFTSLSSHVVCVYRDNVLQKATPVIHFWYKYNTFVYTWLSKRACTHACHRYSNSLLLFYMYMIMHGISPICCVSTVPVKRVDYIIATTMNRRH